MGEQLMVTYAQLESEQVWLDQIVAPFMTSFLIVPLRQFYGLDANTCGAPGDNNHLYGRHRSANWDRQSRYCTDRGYGTTDARDHAGDQNWYRAVDTGIQGDTLHAASHRIDNAVRAGQLPEVAEWFGSFDGVNVVGWYEGHPSSSDSSHLYHLHVGVWTQYANDFQVMQRIFGVVTGTNVAATPGQPTSNGAHDMGYFFSRADGSQYMADPTFERYWAFTGDGSWDAVYAAAGKPPAPVVEQRWIDAGAFGAYQGIYTLPRKPPALGASVELTPEQVAQISGAAHDGAASAIDGATISSSTISTAH